MAVWHRQPSPPSQYTGLVEHGQEAHPSTPRIRVLSTVAVDERPVSGMRPRRLLASLALARPRSVSEAELIDDVWGDDPPQTPRPALQTLVSRIRRLAGSGAIDYGPPGYRLTLPTDLDEIRAAVQDDTGDEADAATLTLIPAAPGADLDDTDVGDRLRSEAERLRASLRESRGRMLVADGRSEEAIALLWPAVEEQPWNEATALLLMEALRASGQASEALRVFAGLRECLADTLGTRPGRAATELNAAILREQDADTKRIGVRAASEPLIGRDEAVQAVEASIRSHRLTTILGVGGLGKTTLAQEVARRSTAPVVAVVELAGTSSEDDVLLTVATGLGIRTGASMKRLADPLIRTDLHTRLAATLGEHPTLLVLDNCEHLVEAVSVVVRDLLDAVPSLRVLCTSRSPLALAEERGIPLDPLDTHSTDGSAVTLFLERARAVRPGAQLSPTEVLTICRRLDGLPLAIELAAARIRTMSLTEVADNLANRFALLRGSGRGSPERHRTLFAVIDWSWRLLDERQRRLLRRLALFADGFSVDSASRVATADSDVLQVHDDLDALVMQSLVTVHETAGSVRFRMLETVREFCRDRLREAGELETVDERMLDWAKQTALTLWPRLFGPPQAATLSHIRREQENLIAVLRHALTLERADVALAVFGLLAPSWMMRDEHDDLMSFGVDVIRLARTRRVPESVADLAALGLTLAAMPLTFMGVLRVGFPALSRARMLWRSGQAQSPQVEAALRMLEMSAWITDPDDLMSVPAEIERLVTSSNRHVAVVASLFGSHIAENAGDVDVALRLAHTAHGLAIELEDRWFAASAAATLGQLHMQVGDSAGAARWLILSVEGHAELEAVQDVRQMRMLLALARIQQDGPTASDVPEPDANPRNAEERSLLQTLRAEAAAFRGEHDEELAAYDRAVLEYDTPRARSSPWYLLATATRVCAHMLAGSAPSVTEHDVRRMRARMRAARRIPRRPSDLPVVGSALLAVSVWASDPAVIEQVGQAAVLELFALAERSASRQDFTPLHRDQHERMLQERFGDAALRRARERAATAPRHDIAVRALALIDVPLLRYGRETLAGSA